MDIFCKRNMNAIASQNQQQRSDSDFEWKAKIPHSVFVVTMVNSACAAAMHPCAKESTLASSSPDQGYLTYINRYHHPIQPLQLMALSAAAAAAITLEKSWGCIGEFFPFFDFPLEEKSSIYFALSLPRSLHSATAHRKISLFICVVQHWREK